MFRFGSIEGRADKGSRLPSQLLLGFTLPFHLRGISAGVSDRNMVPNKRVNPGQASHAGIPIVAGVRHSLVEMNVDLALAGIRPEENCCRETNRMDPDHAGDGSYRILPQSTREEHVKDCKNVLAKIKKFTRHYVTEALQMRRVGREAEEEAVAYADGKLRLQNL